MLDTPHRTNGTTIYFTVNGKAVTVAADPFASLANTLRGRLGLTGTKIGCDAGDCGACTVLIDGRQACACLIATGQAEGAEVHTVERFESLYAEAGARLEQLGYRNVKCSLGDGSRGLPEEAPFDAELVTAASPSIPQPLVEQLGDGGRLVIPIGGPEGQILRRVRKGPPGAAPAVEDLMDVRYVPLVGAFAWPGDWTRSS